MLSVQRTMVAVSHNKIRPTLRVTGASGGRRRRHAQAKLGLADGSGANKRGVNE